MRAIIISCLLLVACDNRLNKGEVYNGLPDGELPACSRDIVHQDRGICVVDGKRYRCVWTARADAQTKWTNVSCSRTWFW